MRHNASTLAEYESPGERARTPYRTSWRRTPPTAFPAVGGPGCRAGCTDQRARSARFTAETTARSEAVVMEVAMPTPQVTLSPIAHST